MGICFCHNRVEESKIYLDFMKNLKIKTIKSEDLIKKIKEKYLTITKEDKRKGALLSEILPLIESNNNDHREFSHSYFMDYFEENKKDFYALSFLCDKDSNFKKTFEEITNTNRNEWLKFYSSDKKKIDKNFLKQIVNSYIKFTTTGTIQYIEKISGNKTTSEYMKNLYDNETRASIVTDLFQPYEDSNSVVDVEQFFKSEHFKTKILDQDEILKMFLTYDSLKSDKKK
jgi:hypothetical protein